MNARMSYCLFSLIAMVGAGLGLTGCGDGAVAGKPELPGSVSPGWVRKSFEHVEPLSGLGGGGRKVECWKALYLGSGAGQAGAGAAGVGVAGGSGMPGAGTAGVWICGFAAESGAFDSAQRFGSGGDRVKFQVGKYLVVVEWSGAGNRAEVTALVRAVQKALEPK